MKPELKQAMEARLAELEPEAARLWEDYKQAEEALLPQQTSMEQKRSEWCRAWEESQWLKRQLGITP